MLDRVVTGTRIDGFTIGEHVHSGAMADIWRVTRPDQTAPMIMKIPRVGVDAPTEGIISFETEATIVPVLSGPHVPRFIAAGDLERMPYLVTEWVEGTSLEEKIRLGALPPDAVAQIGASIADALHSLHRQDAIHLDLKPANVILESDGTAVLVDFGFAHHARYPDLLAEETRHGAGSKPYISPEQILGTREDPRSDLFSLGVVLYEMATGVLPFGEPDTDVRNRLWLDPVPPRVHAPLLPAWMQEVILHCIEPRVERRYQSAAHVAFDLRNPEQVPLTQRATKSARAGVFRQMRRFWRARRLRLPRAPASHTPIVMVAVDTMHPDDAQQPALQRATARIVASSEEIRLLCVSVIPAEPSRLESNVHLEHLIRLRRWVEPLHLPAQRLSLHAIESSNAVDALVELARLNNVDLIVAGASVGPAVAANAHCSVHVVR
ncbi:MAG: serine/threonine protein kinase [Thermoanaerobaculia bacterium]